jgi:hypothetical protein
MSVRLSAQAYLSVTLYTCLFQTYLNLFAVCLTLYSVSVCTLCFFGKLPHSNQGTEIEDYQKILGNSIDAL